MVEFRARGTGIPYGGCSGNTHALAAAALPDAMRGCLLPCEQGGQGSMGEGPDGRYLIVRHLATGGYGSVFEVRLPRVLS